MPSITRYSNKPRRHTAPANLSRTAAMKQRNNFYAAEREKITREARERAKNLLKNYGSYKKFNPNFKFVKSTAKTLIIKPKTTGVRNTTQRRR